MNCGIILNQMLAGGNNYIIRHFNTLRGEALRFHGLSEYYCMRQVGDVIRAYAWIKSHDFSLELLFFRFIITIIIIWICSFTKRRSVDDNVQIKMVKIFTKK